MIVPLRAVVASIQFLEAFNRFTDAVRDSLLYTLPFSGAYFFSFLGADCVPLFLMCLQTIGTIVLSSNSTVLCQCLIYSICLSQKSQPNIIWAANHSETNKFTVSTTFYRNTWSLTVPAIFNGLLFPSWGFGMIHHVFIVFTPRLGASCDVRSFILLRIRDFRKTIFLGWLVYGLDYPFNSVALLRTRSRGSYSA